MFLMALSAIAALGVIAGGSFWTAQSMFRITDNSHRIRVAICGQECPNGVCPSSGSSQSNFVPVAHDDLVLFSGQAVGACTGH
jgi:hypothetical protein